jgi:hypothetical protein
VTHTQLCTRSLSLTRLLFRFVLYANSMCYFHGDSQVPGGEIFFDEMAEVRVMLVCDCKHCALAASVDFFSSDIAALVSLRWSSRANTSSSMPVSAR